MTLRMALFDLFVIATALSHALLEIQIEGKHGWAEKLPTRKFTGKLINWFSELKYITGFHIATGAVIVLFAHLPIFFVSHWSWEYEFLVVGFILLHFTLEDFLWFVFNPHYGIHKFNRKHIWWHKKWFLGVPVGYWVGLPLGLILISVSGVL